MLAACIAIAYLGTLGFLAFQLYLKQKPQDAADRLLAKVDAAEKDASERAAELRTMVQRVEKNLHDLESAAGAAGITRRRL